MAEKASDPDAEFEAMQSVYSALERLGEEARVRVLDYVSSRLGLTVAAKPPARRADEAQGEEGEEAALPATQGPAGAFGSFAELFDAASPKGASDKALVAGYWLQVCQGSDTFDGLSINRDLKNLGEGVPNVTSAIDTLKAQKPALALQLKKSGKSRQARKLYKITVAGVRAVEAMIGG